MNKKKFVNSVHYSEVNLQGYSFYCSKMARRPKNALAKDQITALTCAAISFFVSLAGQYLVTNDKMWR